MKRVELVKLAPIDNIEPGDIYKNSQSQVGYLDAENFVGDKVRDHEGMSFWRPVSSASNADVIEILKQTISSLEKQDWDTACIQLDEAVDLLEDIRDEHSDIGL